MNTFSLIEIEIYFICDQTNIGVTPYNDLFVITPYKTIYIYILGSDKVLRDILTVVQWSSYESFWYMLVTP